MNPPPLCTGTGTLMADYSPVMSSLPDAGLCGVCGRVVPIHMHDSTIAAHGYYRAERALTAREVAETISNEVGCANELAAERDLAAEAHELRCRAEMRAERLEKAGRLLLHAYGEAHALHDLGECDGSLLMREALRPAAPEPTHSCQPGNYPDCCDPTSEQPDLPLGHEFVAGHPHPAYQSYCALRGIFGLCGQPESAHRRK